MVPAGEIRFSFLLRVFRGRKSRARKGVEQHVQAVLPRARRVAACRRCARSPLHRSALPDPGARPPRRARRDRRPGALADGVRQDARLRSSDRRANAARRCMPIRARARADARARRPGDRRSRATGEGQGPPRRGRVRRATARSPGEARQGRPDPRCHSGTSPGPLGA